MEGLRNAIYEHLTSFIEDHQKRLANAEAATSVLKSTDRTTSSSSRSYLNLMGSYRLQSSHSRNLHKRGKKLNPVQSYRDLYIQ